MTEASMVERVARAMADRSKARVAGLHLLNAIPMDGEEDFMKMARAAIEAMREPTEAMVKAGSSMYCNEYEAPDIWEDMIDAAITSASETTR